MGRFTVEWAFNFDEHFESPGEAAAVALGLILSGEYWEFTVVDELTGDECEVLVQEDNGLGEDHIKGPSL